MGPEHYMETITFLSNSIKQFNSESVSPRCEHSGWNPAEQLQTKMIVVAMVVRVMVMMVMMMIVVMMMVLVVIMVMMMVVMVMNFGP